MTRIMTNTDRSESAPIAQSASQANTKRSALAGLSASLRIFVRMWRERGSHTRPTGAIPIQRLSRIALEMAPNRSLYRLGHSTILLKLRDQFWLTDPVFSKRASPFSFAGPKRFHAPPIEIDQLPPIRGVILSHDHYDHLDRSAILALANKTDVFVTPHGVGDRLIAWGIPAHKVQQFGWWEGCDVDGVRLTATPAQHFSGRGLGDRNRTLWASWVIADDDLRLFFSGDTGYFDGFKAIGEQFGPFDLTLMETGAYNAMWPDVHMQPEESLQAHIDLGGRYLLPIHNGTFDLSTHAWSDPFERIVGLAQQRGVSLSTPMMGERISLDQPHAGSAWWRTVDQVSAEHEARRHAPTLIRD